MARLKTLPWWYMLDFPPSLGGEQKTIQGVFMKSGFSFLRLGSMLCTKGLADPDQPSLSQHPQILDITKKFMKERTVFAFSFQNHQDGPRMCSPGFLRWFGIGMKMREMSGGWRC
jgi:hypothetical protein